MKTVLLQILFGSLMVISSTTHANELNIGEIYGSWCLISVASELQGERVPDRANYVFTRDHQLNYDAGFFKQKGAFTIEGNRISTESMGNYKIISLKNNRLVLNYGGYLFLRKGICG